MRSVSLGRVPAEVVVAEEAKVPSSPPRRCRSPLQSPSPNSSRRRTEYRVSRTGSLSSSCEEVAREPSGQNPLRLPHRLLVAPPVELGSLAEEMRANQRER